MNKKTIVALVTFVLVAVGVLVFVDMKKTGIDGEDSKEKINHVTGIVLYKDEDSVIIEDEDENVYEFSKDEIEEKEGTGVSIDYKEDTSKPKEDKKPSTGTPSTGGVTKPATPSVPKVETPDNPKPSNGNSTVIDYTVTTPSSIPDAWLDGGIFSAYYTKAFQKLGTMSLDEKIGQTLIVRYPMSGAESILGQYHLGGYVFFERDFKTKSRQQVIDMISSVQNAAKVPLLTAIDEEGGIVSRISSNPALTASPFKSSQVLYSEGGFDAIVADVRVKSGILSGLGLNLNFAPVVDVSTDPSNYIYKRTLGQGTELTSQYAKSVIAASKGLGVSYTLKHFPGYGSNLDTHVGSSVSKKSYADLMNQDIPPFKAGIAAGAEAVMVSHNIVEAIDGANESSISLQVHNLLRNNLGYTGVIITDDISMGAMKNVANIGGKALAAGNDLIITSDVATTFGQIKTSLANGSVKEEALNRAVFRILAWKYYKGLLS